MEKSKKRKLLIITGSICICLLIAIIAMIIVIRLRIETSFNASYRAYQVECTVKQSLIHRDGLGNIKENGVKVLETLKFDAKSKNEIKKTGFPPVELHHNNTTGLDYVTYSAIITNDGKDTSKELKAVLEVSLSDSSNLKAVVDYEIGESVYQNIVGSTVGDSVTYTFEGVGVGETIKVNVKLCIKDKYKDIVDAKGEIKFNLRSNTIS